MNWPLFFSTFTLIFLAELGDKTQLAVLSQSAASSSKWTVFAAGALALVASTAIGVLAGDVIRRLVPDERYIKCAGGILFLIFGGLMLRETFYAKPKPSAAAEPASLATVSANGWAGRFVIQQVAVLEKAAFEDYLALAERSNDPAERAVFLRLAKEERWHHEAMLSALASGADKDIPISDALAGALPPLDDLIQDAAKASGAVEHAIGHELAMARFYRTLSKKCMVPRLRGTFEALAVAEDNHVRRLTALKNGSTDDSGLNLQ